MNVLLSLFMVPLLLMSGCGKPPEPQRLVTQMRIGTEQFKLEVADTPPKRSVGLMWRDSMPADHGMIFIFPQEQLMEFWMKNTRIPLDILYLDSAGRVVAIGQMEPFSGRAASNAPARYAIELNAGTADRVGVGVGDTLQLPPDITALKVAK